MRKIKLLFLITVFFFSVSLFAEADKIEKYKLELSEMQDSYVNIEGQYLSPLVLNQKTHVSASASLKKGDYYFLKKDYISSGSVYYSVFNSRQKKDFIWEEAVFKLAESLFLNKNYISATRYYEILATTMPNSRYKIKTLKRLISASYYLGEYSMAKKYYSEFVQIGYDISKDSELIYFLGKSLFFDSQYSDAYNVFKTIKKDSKYYLQSLYFMGVIKLQDKKYKSSIKFFKKITVAKGHNYFKTKTIKSLANLALGRLYFQLKDYNDAINYYLKLDWKSKYFAESYYELCWTYIKKKEYRKAIDALRRLKYIDPSSIIVPNAELLEGNLLMKIGKYGDAMVLFNNVVKKYDKIKKALQSYDAGNLKLDFNAVSGSNAIFSAAYSPIVRSLFKDNLKYKSILKLNDDIAFLESQLFQTVKIENKLKIIMQNKNVASVFPPLKKGTEKAVALQNHLISFKNKLLELKKSKSWQFLSPEDKEKFLKLEDERKKLRKNLKDMPVSEIQLEKKASEYAKKIIKMEEDIHMISLQTASFYTQIDTITAYYIKEKAKGNPNKIILDKLSKEKENVMKIIKELKNYAKVVEKEKNKLMLGGDMITKMIILRNKYKMILDSEDELLKKTDSLKFGRDSEIDRLIYQTDSLYKKTDMFYDKLNLVVGKIISKIKSAYDAERIKLDSYKSEVMQLKKEINEVSTLAILSNINKVKASFNDLVLRADLGIIDVAWEKKEQASDKLLEYRKKMAKEIKLLYMNLENLE